MHDQMLKGKSVEDNRNAVVGRVRTRLYIGSTGYKIGNKTHQELTTNINTS